MRIALVTEDGSTISQHFGRAPYYAVVTVEGGKIVARERREKLGHAQLAGEHHEEGPHGQDPRGHGFDAAAQSRHGRMLAAVADCEILVARGMGAGAYHTIRQAGLRPILTDVVEIDAAALAAAAGTLEDHSDRLH
jgi:predicted Fe-Mo cluster-binding NifX family protein